MCKIAFRVWDGERVRDEHSQDTVIDHKGRWSVSIAGKYVCDFRSGILMQYTGLKDKNGKKVYEGDILGHAGRKHPYRHYWVEWKAYKWKLKRMIDGEPKGGHPFSQVVNHPENFEIIGNIYENPELLKD